MFSVAQMVSVMLELNNQIARLEMRSEQLRLHLCFLKWDSVAAEQARWDLFRMLQHLVVLRGQRHRLELELDRAA
jgi:hypothetical protein